MRLATQAVPDGLDHRPLLFSSASSVPPRFKGFLGCFSDHGDHPITRFSAVSSVVWSRGLSISAVERHIDVNRCKQTTYVSTSTVKKQAVSRSLFTPCHPDRVRASEGSKGEWKLSRSAGV